MKTKKCTICLENKPVENFHGGLGNYQISCRCKLCDKHYKREQGRTKDGLIRRIYSSQLSCSIRRKHPKPTYSLEELINWFYKQSNFNLLYSTWVESNYKRHLRPSCDRIDEYTGYTLENIQLISWKENELRGYTNRLLGINNKINQAVDKYSLDDVFLERFYSQSEAARKSNTIQSNISNCCLGKRKSAGGYKWKHVK